MNIILLTVHLMFIVVAQAATAAQLVPGALLPVPSYPAPRQPAAPVAPPQRAAAAAVKLVEHQGGRLMVGATWAAAPSGRQMTLVRS